MKPIRKTIQITIICILLLFVSTMKAQNFLKSLYDLESFPEEMQRSKEFIEETSSDRLIYNFIFGGSELSQFDLKSKNGIKIDLPFKDEFSLVFFDDEAKKLLTSYTLHYSYRFLYNKFYDEFELDDSIFSLSSIFDLALKYYDVDDYELVSRLLALNYGNDYDSERLKFFEKLAKVLELEDIPDFSEMISSEEKKKLFDKEKERLMLNTVFNETDYEDITPFIFTHFILDEKSELETKKVLDLIFFQEGVTEIIEREVLQPKISVDLDVGGYLNLPNNYIEINQSDIKSFPINLIKIRVDYKNKKLLIDFENENPLELIIKKAIRDTSKVKEASVKTNRIRLVISNSESILKIYEHNPFKNANDIVPYEIELK